MWLTMSRTVSGDEGAAGMRMSMASVSDISWHETDTDTKEYRIWKKRSEQTDMDWMN
jgi:hypothetical protein